jgi:hypothetical protein
MKCTTHFFFARKPAATHLLSTRVGENSLKCQSASPTGLEVIELTVDSVPVAYSSASMTHRCQPRDNGETFDSPEPGRSRSPPPSECRRSTLSAPHVAVVAYWPNIQKKTLLTWWQKMTDSGVYGMETIEEVAETFKEILRFCGHRTATLPFAAGLRVCAHVQAAMQQQDSPPDPVQVPLFGSDLEPVPAQRSLCHLRLLPEPKKHDLQMGLALARPLFTKMLSLEPGLQKHMALSDLQCLIDDVLHVFAREQLAQCT